MSGGPYSDGWHYFSGVGDHELWRDGRLVHSVSAEAWEDFLCYLDTRSGERFMEERRISRPDMREAQQGPVKYERGTSNPAGAGAVLLAAFVIAVLALCGIMRLGVHWPWP